MFLLSPPLNPAACGIRSFPYIGIDAFLALSVADRMSESAEMFPRVLRRDVLILLAAKAAGLTILYLMFFAPSLHPMLNANAVQTHILADGPNGHR